MNPEMSPEMVLWSRVLLQAIWDLAGIKLKVQKSEAPRLQRRTRAWFLAKKDSPGSFIWICNILGLDPDAVRDRVLARSTAELRSLITSQPDNWDPASIVRESREEDERVNSDGEPETGVDDPAPAQLLCEESQSDSDEDAPFEERVAVGGGTVFRPAQMPGLQETSAGNFA